MRPLVLLVLFALATQAAPAIVSSNSNFGATSAAASFSPNTTAGNMIWVGCGNVGNVSLTVSHTMSGTLTQVQTLSPAGNRVMTTWILKNIVGGADTVTCSGGNFGVTIFIAEISGTSTTNTQPDVKSSNPSSTTTTIQPGSITNTVASEIFLSMSWATNTNASVTLSVDSSYTIIQNIHNSGGGVFTDASIAWLLVSSTGATNPTWTRTNATGTSGWGATNEGYSCCSSTGRGPKGKLL